VIVFCKFLDGPLDGEMREAWSSQFSLAVTLAKARAEDPQAEQRTQATATAEGAERRTKAKAQGRRGERRTKGTAMGAAGRRLLYDRATTARARDMGQIG
jgi:hypothetical protein